MATEVVEVEGHIIDSLILAKVLDTIVDAGAEYRIVDVDIGRASTDTSRARIEIQADDEDVLTTLVTELQLHGANRVEDNDAVLDACDRNGVLPEGFYSTTNLKTQVRLGGHWTDVDNPEMDCAIVVRDSGHVTTAPMHRVRVGDQVVVGLDGVRVQPLERPRGANPFEFMASEVSSEKPKELLVAEVADRIKARRADGGKILAVCGPAVIHTGSARYLSRLIELGYVQVLFAGNALATHDVEAALLGTSLGVNLESGLPIESGHEHHMRAINRVRAAGSIKALVDSGEIKTGVMKSCLDHGVEVVLAGSVRDDGPLPEVITDMIQAQDAMRERIPGVRMCLMLSTMLHSIATGNMLPAAVRTVCVDMNPAVVTKLADRGSWQSIGLVTDVESFLRELVLDLE